MCSVSSDSQSPVSLQFLTFGNTKLGKLIFLTPAKIHLEHQTRQHHFLESVITVSLVVLNTPRHTSEFCFAKWETKGTQVYVFFVFHFSYRELVQASKRKQLLKNNTEVNFYCFLSCKLLTWGKKKSNRFSGRIDFVG